MRRDGGSRFADAGEYMRARGWHFLPIEGWELFVDISSEVDVFNINDAVYGIKIEDDSYFPFSDSVISLPVSSTFLDIY